MENTLIVAPAERGTRQNMTADDRADVYHVMFQLDRFFNLEPSGT